MNALSTKIPGDEIYLVAAAQRSEDVLLLRGDCWSFTSECEWRLTRKGRIVSSSQYFSEGALNELLGRRIIRVAAQSREVPVDPCIWFEGDLILEIFSTDEFEPWTFTAVDGIVFVGMT